MSFIKKLASKLNKSEPQIAGFLFDAPKKYRVYTIPKRTHGHRVIAQPTKELKEYQRAFLDIYSFPIHRNSMAYKKDISIKDNAQRHNKQSFLLRMDFENFFNSITPALFWNTWKMLRSLPDEFDQNWIEKLLFWSPGKINNNRLVLSIGAPSSPLISNFCMYLFDEVVTQFCQENEIHYTRYADDLTFSTNKKGGLFSIPSVVKNKLTDCFGNQLLINHRKTVFSSKAHNRHVTGITITNDQKLSLGRERKRYIKHLVHQFQFNKLDKDYIMHLQGLLSFAKHIEPQFLVALKSKYSEALIQSIIEIKYDE